MDFEYIDENIIKKYCRTLIRKDILNIQSNKFIKKPYLENYIIKLSFYLDESLLKNKIIELYESNKITVEEILLFMNNNIEISNTEKKNLEKFIFNNNNNNNDNLFFDIIKYQIKYFKFYNIVTELLFDNIEEDNELYNFILIFIKNKNSEIKTYLKKNIKFCIFYYYLTDLYNCFDKIIILFIENNIFFNIDKKEKLNLFIKNLFSNWYNIYKKDILEDKVNEKIKDYKINSNLLSRILCLPGI
jgi:hypothetical protein